MFNSIGRSSNFAIAGKAGANDLVKSFAAARRNSTDANALAQGAAILRSKEKQAITKITAESYLRKNKVDTAVKVAKIEDKANKSKKASQRKAGALAVASQSFNSAGSLLGEKRTKRTVGEGDSVLQERIDKSKKTAEDYRRQIEEMEATTNIPTPENSTPKTGTEVGSSMTGAQTAGLQAIRDVESGSLGYEAYNLGGRTEFDPIGSGSANDGRFGKPLTQMTIGQIKQLGNEGKIHATGAYQFTHNTGSFGEAASFAGLSDNDLFTPANQDSMALAFGQRYGWERWSGLKKDPKRAAIADLGFQ